MNNSQSSFFPSTLYQQTTKIELAIATSAGAFMFACYGIVCVWLVYLSRHAKDDATVKRRVFIYSLLTCIARVIQYCSISFMYFKPYLETAFYIHGLVSIFGDACLLNSLCSVFFSWIRLLRTYFSSFPPIYTPQHTTSVILALRAVSMSNFTLACFVIIIFYVTDNEYWATLGDFMFGIAFMMGLVGMVFTGFILKKKLEEAGCANLRALKIVRVMVILSISGLAIFSSTVGNHWFRDQSETFVLMTFLRITAELTILSTYIYFFGNKHLRLMSKKKQSNCFTLSALRKSYQSSALSSSIQLEIPKERSKLNMQLQAIEHQPQISLV